MYLPFIKPSTQKTQRQVVRFGGLNRTQDFREGELADTVGLSSQEWPCLTQRSGMRLKQSAYPGFSDLYAWDKLVTVQRTSLSYGGKSVGGTLSEGKKQFAVINTKLCIFPDKKYLDLESMELCDMEAKTETVERSVQFGEDYLELRGQRSIMDVYEWIGGYGTPAVADMTFQVYAEEDLNWDPKRGWATVPAGKVSEKTLLELKAGDCIMLEWSAERVNRPPIYEGFNSSGEVEAFDAWGDYMYLTQDPTWEIGVGHSAFDVNMERRNAQGKNPDFSKQELKVGDTVTISGCETLAENNVDIRIEAIEDTKITFSSPVLTPGEEMGAVRLERRVPDMDFICESENRLVGVSNADKTIYISALGDPRNFYDYRGLSVSSSYIPVGSKGDFTGCIAYGGNVLLFKETCMHRLMGSYDGNYALYTDQVAGLQAGCERSMAILGEVLYYKGREGVYAYTGSTPSLISAALGDVRYQNAVAGTDGQRYYVSMQRRDTEAWETLAYDTRTGLWMKEAAWRVDAFAEQGGTLHALMSGDIYTLGEGELDRVPAGLAGEDRVISWEATFTPFDETNHRRKYPSRLLLRLELGEGAWVEVELARDNGPFKNIWTGHGEGRTAVIPIRPGRCDKYQLRLKGEGRCLVRSMERDFSLGGVW